MHKYKIGETVRIVPHDDQCEGVSAYHWQYAKIKDILDGTKYKYFIDIDHGEYCWCDTDFIKPRFLKLKRVLNA